MTCKCKVPITPLFHELLNYLSRLLKTGPIKSGSFYFSRTSRKMDRRSTHKKGKKGLALEQLYANFVKFSIKSLESQYKELYKDISYTYNA